MPNKKVIIRVDGNSNIGLGHIYRGIALAHMLDDEFDVSFITKLTSNRSPITDAKFNLEFIPEGVKLKDEPEYFVTKLTPDTIIVLDGYEFDEVYQQKIKDFDFKLVYLDDLVQGLQKADMVINHSPGVKKSDYKTEAYTKLALGLDYALLRKSFLNYKRPKKKVRKKTKKIFVSFGGADPIDFSFKVVKEIVDLSSVMKINVILGSAYQHNDIYNIESEKIEIYKNLSESEMLHVMVNSDLAIAPASTTLFELFSIGIPIMSGYYVNNQKLFYEYLYENDLIYGVGDFNMLKIEDFKNTIIDFINSDFFVKTLIDGKQESRIQKLFKTI